MLKENFNTLDPIYGLQAGPPNFLPLRLLSPRDHEYCSRLNDSTKN